MKKILETERLILREFDLDDAAFIVELLNTPGWIKFIGNKNVNSPEEAKAYLQNGPMKSYELNGFGLSMVELKYVGVPIGMCGLIKRDTLDDIDIGFAILPEFAGTGYGHEIASATLDYAKSELGLKRVIGITGRENKISIRLLEKIGLEYERMTSLPKDKNEILLFGINFED